MMIAGTQGNPRFVAAGGMASAMQLSPPFDFDGVTLRVFPLRASLWHLQRFVDGYLNIVPPQVGRFRVPLPFTYLQLINYGKMSVDAANLGWIAQREILFCIPLEWYRLVDGRYEFVDWAFVSPFIYVDNELSMTTGREVYGWPKSLALFDRELDDWMDDPRASPRLATASTTLFPAAYRGSKQVPRRFLQILQGAAPSPSRVLPDLGSSFLPWIAIPQLIRSSAALSRDGLSILASMGVTRAQPYLGADAYAAMGKTLARDLDPRDPRMIFNTINLKQFRSADSPESVCYQGVTNAKMDLKRFKSGGLLGDDRMVFGDPSGGFRIELHDYTSTPSVGLLGIEACAERAGPDGTRITTHEPVLPFWMDVDMRYNPGETLAWRTKLSPGWTVGVGPSAREYVKSGDVPRENPYNTSVAGAGQEIAGPFDFPDTTLRVLPLRADRDKLVALVDDYLNEPLAGEGMHFEPWGSAVYLVIGNHNGVSSAVNDVGWWADRDVTFYVPVKWYSVAKDGSRELRSIALVPVFSYANSTTAAITRSEVSGIPVMKATVSDPTGTWMAPGGPGEDTSRPLVRVSTTVLPVLGLGQGAEDRVILEVDDGPVCPAGDEAQWRHIGETWGKAVRDELAGMWDAKEKAGDASESALSLALEVLARGRPINSLTLKQFRDASDPERACYQSLVLIRREIERVHDLREMEASFDVRIYDYPTQPIVSSLGLLPKHVSYDGGARAYSFEPVRPFWLRVSLRERLGTTVCRRAGSERWSPDPLVEEAAVAGYFAREADAQGAAPTRIAANSGSTLQPRRLAAQLTGVLPDDRHAGDAAPPLSREAASAAIEQVDPHMIVSTVLSREWENWGTPRWSRAKEALSRQLEESIRDALPDERPAKTVAFLRELVARCDQLEHDSGGAIAPRTRRRADLRDELLHQSDLLTKIAKVRDDVARAADRGMAAIAEVILAIARDKELHDAALRAIAEVGESDEATASERPAVHQVLDEIASASRGEDASADTEARARAASLAAVLFQKPIEIRARLRSLIVEHVTKAFAERREALLQELSLSAQKPDYCAPRSGLLGPERELLFPREECWYREDAEWFVGVVRAPRAARRFAEACRSGAASGVPLLQAGAAGPNAFDDSRGAHELGSIRAVSVWCGDIVDAVRVTYDGGTLDKHGGPGGARHDREFSPDDPLVAVVAHYGDYFGAEHLVGLELLPRSAVIGTKPASPPIAGGAFPRASRTERVSALELAGARAEIGSFFGTTVTHTDGTVGVGHLDEVVVVPDEA